MGVRVLAAGRSRAGLLAALVTAGVSVVVLAGVTPPAFPFGDVAIIEITTAAALRGPVTLGPYSQFGWHHPGPLLFYVLAPFYALAGWNSIGLAAGALFVNLLSLGAIGWSLVRHAGSTVALTVTLILAGYLLRGGELATSVWNPHFLVLPLVAAVVLCAAASLGDRRALVPATFFVSFVAQANVSVGPVTAAVAAVATGLGWVGWRHGPRAEAGSGRWVAGAALVGLICWLPPLTEQLTSRPGNMTRLLDFFVSAPSQGQSLGVAVLAWSDVTTAILRPGFEPPWGQAFDRRGSWGTAALAVVQFALLIGVALWARRRGHRALCRLSLLTGLASLVACWSITRIVRTIGDYQIFWMSAVGALNLALLVAATAVYATADAPGRRRRLAGVVGALLALLVCVTTVGGLSRARQYAVSQRALQAPRRVAAEATVAYLQRARIARPLFRMNSISWLQAAGVVLHAYRRGGVAVAEEWVPVFGEALAPNGTEDAELEIGGGCPAGRLVVARADGLCVFTVEPRR